MQQAFERMKNDKLILVFVGENHKNIVLVISRLTETFDFEDSSIDKITNSFQVKIYGLSTSAAFQTALKVTAALSRTSTELSNMRYEQANLFKLCCTWDQE